MEVPQFVSADNIILRLVIAALLGSLIGIERERLDWAPGLRTHMLVCLGSCLFMIVSAHGFRDVLTRPDLNLELDVSRVAAQVASGVGFLGAGTIILRKNVIKGLTTAASLWTVAAVGLAVGGGLYIAASFTTFLILLILAVIKPIEKRIFRNYHTRVLTMAIGPETTLMEVRTVINNHHISLKQVSMRESEEEEIAQELEIELSKINPQKLLPLVEELRSLKGIRHVNYRAN